MDTQSVYEGNTDHCMKLKMATSLRLQKERGLTTGKNKSRTKNEGLLLMCNFTQNLPSLY